MYDSSKPYKKSPPVSKKAASFTSSFIDDKYCFYVEMYIGVLFMCVFCEFLPVNNGQPFTTGRWIEHNNSASHNRKVEQHEHMEKIKADKSSNCGPVSEKELF